MSINPIDEGQRATVPKAPDRLARTAWPLPADVFVELLTLPARRFIRALTGSDRTAVTFQCFVPDGSAGDPRLNRILHGNIFDHGASLIALNDAGAAISITLNQTDACGRKAENIVAIRALFVDCDDDLRIEPPLQPSFVVVGRERRAHLYFKLRAGEERSLFSGMQVLLSRYYSGDPVVNDLNRCVRLPGFFHWKDGSRVVPTVIFAPSWHVDQGVVRFVESDGVNVLDDEADVVEGEPEIPEYSINEILAAHGYTREDLSIRSAAQTPIYLVESHPEADRLSRARAYAESTPGAIEQRGGDEHTYKLACKLLRGFDLDEDAVFIIMSAWNKTCVPPWAPDELRRKIRMASERSSDPVGYLLKQSSDASAENASTPVPFPALESTEFTFVTSLGDFLNEPDDLVPSYWGDSLLDKGTVLLISGPMMSWKSWFVIQLALTLTSGGSFLGHTARQKTRVLLMECESGRAKYRQRIRKVAAAMGIDVPTETLFVRKLQSSVPQIGPELEIAVRESRAEVVIMDTLNNFYVGEENSNSEIQNKVYYPLRRLAMKLEWTPSFVLVHHFSKTSSTANPLPSRGAAMLEHGAGSIIHLERELDADTTKLTFKKVKDADPKDYPPKRLSFENYLLSEIDGCAPPPSLRPEIAERFRFCREFALTREAAVKTADFTVAVMARFGLSKEIARKSAPEAAKYGYLKLAGAKGYYLPGDRRDELRPIDDACPDIGGMGGKPFPKV